MKLNTYKYTKQHPQLFSGTESLDVVFLLHFSQTLTSTAHVQILEFMKSIIQYSGLEDGKVKVGAAILRKKGTVVFDLDAHSGQQDVFEAIDKISYTYRFVFRILFPS